MQYVLQTSKPLHVDFCRVGLSVFAGSYACMLFTLSCLGDIRKAIAFINIPCRRKCEMTFPVWYFSLLLILNIKLFHFLSYRDAFCDSSPQSFWEIVLTISK